MEPKQQGALARSNIRTFLSNSISGMDASLCFLLALCYLLQAAALCMADPPFKDTYEVSV
jgi:hypothetical protein